MASFLTAPTGYGHDGLVLDAAECTELVPLLSALLEVKRRRSRNALAMFPARTQIVYEMAQRVTVEGHRTSASGNGVSAATPAVGMLDTVKVAQLLKITPRQARRRCAEIGTKVGGRWFVRETDL